MKKILSIIIIMSISSYIQAQDINSYHLEAINSQVAAKARLFCKYVVAVGSSAGQKGAVPEAQKLDITRNRVPRLFYNYESRYMQTTNGRNGKIVKRQPMSQYFTKLRKQAANGTSTTRKYELRYVGIKPQTAGKDKSVFKIKETTSDGCTLYVSTIVIDQIYHVVTWGGKEGPTIIEEHDQKEMEVNILAQPNGKANVYLGDVTRVYRK